MSDPTNDMHGPHCQGKFIHCVCNECHGRPVEEANYAVNATDKCGHHCLGHYCDELLDDGMPCQGRLSENSLIHCKCKICHNIPDVNLNKLDNTISFAKPAG